MVLAATVAAGAADAGQGLPSAFDGPPPPVPPAVITRDNAGRATLRAVRLTTPLTLDGQLTEEIYTVIPSASDLIQIEPRAGELATEQTEVWVMFDDEHIYVSVRCWESRPDRMVLNEMRRDNTNLYFNDHFDVVLDTFYDRRNAVFFTVTANGGLADGQVADERQWMSDWNPVWDAHVGRFAGGWSAELAIPFKSLSYRPGRSQTWSFNLQRENWAHNEISTLTRMPAALGNRGVMQISLAPTLVGLEVPPASKKLDIKPYVVSDLTTDRTLVPQVSNEVGGSIGFDVRYGLGQNFTTDFTYNTDFAQVEADEQQVNLTRFSLFFPEKREFFLENQGLFAFGGAATGVLGAVADTPVLFYSRRIGLHQGAAVPLEAGGRLTGRQGRFSIGLLNVQADSDPALAFRATNFSVIRIKQNVLRRSSIGVIYTGRSIDQLGGGRNDAYGIDGMFPFFDNLTFNAYWARTRSQGLTGKDTSHRLQMDYAGDRYGVQVERLVVGDHFNPEVGFVRRDDMRRHFGQFRFSPRPKESKAVRKLFWTGSMAYVENGDGHLETREGKGEFAIEFHNSDRFNVVYGSTYEFLPRPFPIAAGVVLPVGGYDFNSVRAGFNAGQQRPVSGNLAIEYGTFYSGHKSTVGISRGRYNLTPKISVEPSVSFNWVDLAEGAFTTHVIGSRLTYTRTSRMFVSALLQYNSGASSIGSNVRLRWEYRPGSEIFLVYNDQRDTRAAGFPTLANRALIFKFNRLLRF
jgi:hypothetical protein